MDKQTILNAVIKALEEELRRHLKAQEAAAEGATHAESRAETKWDTCGLEASYLARGLAKQFELLAKQVDELKATVPADFTDRPIAPGALVLTEMNGFKNLFFLLNAGGGIEVTVDGTEINVITPEAPVGASLLGKKIGDSYSFRAGVTGKVLKTD